MNEIDKLKQAADIIKQVDVTDIITNMGIGIAHAQEQLDKNSIKQALALADPETGFGGKSLLELGFVPTFYNFQYADISAEIELKMRLATDFEIGGSLSVGFSKQGGYTKKKLDYLRKDRETLHREEFKSSRAFLTTCSNSEELTILTNTVNIDLTKGSIERVEDFTDQIRLDAAIDRVSVEIDSEKYAATDTSGSFDGSIKNIGGYTVITLPNELIITDEVSILRISDYTVDDVISYSSSYNFTMDGSLPGETGTLDTFDKIYDTIQLYPAIPIIGFDSANNQFIKDGGVAENLEIFFEVDNDNAADTLDQTLTEDMVTKDNAAMKETFLVLAQILRKDPALTIKLIGHTDGTASDAYNINLSRRRSASLKEWFVGQGVPEGQITVDGLGEEISGGDETTNIEFRKVAIEITSSIDYFYTKSVPGLLNGSAPDGLNANGNGFLYLFDGDVDPATVPFTFSFEANGLSYSFSGVTTSTFEGGLLASGVTTDFSYIIRGRSAYLLHNEAILKYVVFSNQKEEITFRTGTNKSETFEDTESKYLIDETSNTSSRIKSASEKVENPSTVAVGLSVDGRHSRQFSIDVSGNARMAARIVALPAPNQFLVEIKEIFNQ